MKTGFYPTQVKLRLFFKWGIVFPEKIYSVPDKGNRLVSYAKKNDLEQEIIKIYAVTSVSKKMTNDEIREREMDRPSVKTVRPGPGPFQQHRKPGERTAHLPSPGDEDKGDAIPLSQSNLSVGDVKAKAKEIIFDENGKLYDEDEIEPKKIIFGEDGVIVDAKVVGRI